MAFGVTVLAGFAAFLGVFSIFCIPRKWLQKIIPIVLFFSAGIILHLSFLILVPHAIDSFHHALHDNESLSHSEVDALSHCYSLLCIVGGIVLMLIFEHFGPDHHHGATTDHELDSFDETANPKGADPKDKLLSDPRFETADGVGMKYLSYKIAFALVLHHLPEGIATYTALVNEFEFGVLIALALSLHDIPSGISIGTTIYCATGSIVQPFILCLIAALAYPLGAAIGYIIMEQHGDSELLNGILFGLVSGLMIHIVFLELLPTAITAVNRCEDKKVRKWSFMAMFAGMILMEISMILLALTGGHGHSH